MAKQINKLQLEAVVSTIRKNLEKQDEKTLEACRESLKKSKKYKEFVKTFDNIQDLEKERNNFIESINAKLKTEKKKAHDLIDEDSRFYDEDYSFSNFKYKEKRFISEKLEELNTPLKANNFNSQEVKNELLIASIDPEFSIQAFINKYSI